MLRDTTSVKTMETAIVMSCVVFLVQKLTYYAILFFFLEKFVLEEFRLRTSRQKKKTKQIESCFWYCVDNFEDMENNTANFW